MAGGSQSQRSVRLPLPQLCLAGHHHWSSRTRRAKPPIGSFRDR